MVEEVEFGGRRWLKFRRVCGAMEVSTSCGVEPLVVMDDRRME